MKGCTVQITKKESHDSKHVDKLANNIVKPLLEHLLTNINAKGLLAENKQIKPEPLSPVEEKLSIDCDICGSELQSLFIKIPEKTQAPGPYRTIGPWWC